MARELKPEPHPALADRKARARGTNLADRVREVEDYLHGEVRPLVPSVAREKKITKREREAILGIGSRGYPE